MEMDLSNRLALRLRWPYSLSRSSCRSPRREAPIAAANPQVDSHSTGVS